VRIPDDWAEHMLREDRIGLRNVKRNGQPWKNYPNRYGFGSLVAKCKKKLRRFHIIQFMPLQWRPTATADKIFNADLLLLPLYKTAATDCSQIKSIHSLGAQGKMSYSPWD
jgi:hypothetical protein